MAWVPICGAFTAVISGLLISPDSCWLSSVGSCTSIWRGGEGRGGEGRGGEGRGGEGRGGGGGGDPNGG